MNNEFTKAEIAYGIKLESEIAAARILVAERERQLQNYISFLAGQRGLTGEIAINDWLIGFEGVNSGELHNQ